MASVTRTSLFRINLTKSKRIYLPNRLCSTQTSSLLNEDRRIAHHPIKWKAVGQTNDDAATLPTPTGTSTDTSTARPAGRMDGRINAANIRHQISEEVCQMIAAHGERYRPGLAVILVGDRADSLTYVRAKRIACSEVGIRSIGVELPASISQNGLEAAVRQLNDRADVHGILVQLPLPVHLDEERVLGLVGLQKDVDGLHPLNFGRLCMKDRSSPLAIPCTPSACMKLLDLYGVAIARRKAVVIGRSNIVGLPMAMLLMHRNATVTICHSDTVHTRRHVREADIVVVACGVPRLVRKDWLKEGAVVLDVGINAICDHSRKKGFRLVGDVDFGDVVGTASWISPVPGGVGPMTIAMLLKNTLTAAKRQLGLIGK